MSPQQIPPPTCILHEVCDSLFYSAFIFLEYHCFYLFYKCVWVISESPLGHINVFILTLKPRKHYIKFTISSQFALQTAIFRTL